MIRSGLLSRSVRSNCCWLCACLGVLSCLAAPSFAQQTWEYSPYSISLWVVLEDRPELSPRLAADVTQSIVSGARSSAGYAWRINPSVCPPEFRADALYQPGAISVDRLLKFDKDLLRADKLVIVSVREVENRFRVTACELDCPTRQWSDTPGFATAQLDAVPSVALSAFTAVIRVLAKVEKVDGKHVIARLRAGGLIENPNSPANLAAGRVVQPVIRRNGRNGLPTPGGIYAPNWSYVTIESQTGTALRGTLHSGYGNVIPVKGGPRTERLLLGLNVRHPNTHLELVARPSLTPGGKAVGAGRPLVGYEVFAKNPGDEKTELIGLTDWRGGVDIPSNGAPLRLLYIRNGGQLLARLPLVVGQHEAATANVLDDDARLQVETYVKSLQSRVLDLVARREILAVRIRAKIKKGDFAEAKKLVKEYRDLPARNQLQRELEELQRRSTATGITAKRTEALFQSGHKLLQGFLNPGTADQLAREVAEAEKQGASS